jgi:hypothetical protein
VCEIVPPRLGDDPGAVSGGYFGGSIDGTGINDDDLVNDTGQAFQAC